MLLAEMRWEDVEVGSSCNSFCVVGKHGGGGSFMLSRHLKYSEGDRGAY